MPKPLVIRKDYSMNGARCERDWRIYSIADVRDKRQSQYTWLYIRLIGGFKVKLVYSNKNDETTLESRYFGTFESFQQSWEKHTRGLSLKPQYVTSVLPED